MATSRASSRLNLFTKHLDSRPLLELNTPFSTERAAQLEDDQGNWIPRSRTRPKEKETEQKYETPEAVELVKETVQETKAKETVKMSSQPPHPALMIPGPIEFDDQVLQAMSHYR